MAKEIRRVPDTWKHPLDKYGNSLPLYDGDYEAAAEEWMQDLVDWEADDSGLRSECECICEERLFWWDSYEGSPPPKKANYHAAHWAGIKKTHYQIYETTLSKGTPTSPVFASLDEMREWMLSVGYSERIADIFIECGYAGLMAARVHDGKGRSFFGNDIKHVLLDEEEK